LFVFAVLGLELRAYTLSYSTSLFFALGISEIYISCDLFCPGWLGQDRTVILLISASSVARLTAVSHWSLAHPLLLQLKYILDFHE
jgi:hypothetical protein